MYSSPQVIQARRRSRFLQKQNITKAEIAKNTKGKSGFVENVVRPETEILAR